MRNYEDLDHEYLSRPLLDGLEFIYDSKNIKISSTYSIFLQYVHLPIYTQKEILSCYSDVIKLCREMGIKIRYKNKYKSTIIENWVLYTEEYKKYCMCYNEILEMLPKLEKRGIHVGCSDDIYLKEITNKKGSLDSFYYRNTVLSQINSIYRELKKIKRDLTFEKEIANKENSIYGRTITLYL